MSLLKLLPIGAIGVMAYVNRDALSKSLNLPGKFQAAATAGTEMQHIADAVTREYVETEQLPLADFRSFLRDHLRSRDRLRDPSQDPWGTPFKLARAPEGFRVLSAGPDKRWNTSDDLVRSYTLEGVGTGPGAGSAKPNTPGTRTPTAGPQPGAAQTASGSASLSGEALQKVVGFQMREAARGSARSQFYLGLRYLEGDGIERDVNAARKWLGEAVKNAKDSSLRDRAAAKLKEAQKMPR